MELCRDELQEGRRVFKRMYVCLSACKKGWEAGYRPMISLDGCFLKTKLKGELLIALGRDSDEQNYPIVWACVRNETNENWTWFLTQLQTYMELGDDGDFTLISNLQKVIY